MNESPARTAQPPGPWKLHDAKARFSELVRLVSEAGPQHATVNGNEKAVPLPELRRKQPAPAVIDFLAAQPLHQLYVSPVTFAEIRYGIELLADARQLGREPFDRRDRIVFQLALRDKYRGGQRYAPRTPKGHGDASALSGGRDASDLTHPQAFGAGK